MKEQRVPLNKKLLCSAALLLLATSSVAFRPVEESRIEVLWARQAGESEAIDRGRQRRTMADMRNIAVANGTMRVHIGRYANNLAELTPTYMKEVPAQDAWDNDFVYVLGEDTYTLTSLGSDGAVGPPSPARWADTPFDPDIVLRDGLFVQAPTGR